MSEVQKVALFSTYTKEMAMLNTPCCLSILTSKNMADKRWSSVTEISNLLASFGSSYSTFLVRVSSSAECFNSKCLVRRYHTDIGNLPGSNVEWHRSERSQEFSSDELIAKGRVSITTGYNHSTSILESIPSFYLRFWELEENSKWRRYKEWSVAWKRPWRMSN